MPIGKRIVSALEARMGFRHFGKNALIKPPWKQLSNKHCISIGDETFIGEFCWLSVVTSHEGTSYSPTVVIGDNTCIGSYFILTCINRVEIGNNVLVSDRVFIGDSIHCYEDITMPVAEQGMCGSGYVKIEDDCFLGINSVILPNVVIGKHAVIGASSVVTKNIPPYSVAVGKPARVIRKYNFTTGEWIDYR